MRLARILGAIGRGLISAGVIVLLFVGYQLWGTNLQASAAQSELETELEEVFESDAVLEAQQILAEAEEERAAAAASAEAAADGDAADAADDGSAEPVETAALVETDLSDLPAEFVSKVYPEAGESLARINIPDISVDWVVVEGVSVEDLRNGPGHYGSTPMPGQAGNSAIAGHRTTYGAPFHRIDELEPGDPIIVTSALGTFEYKVTENVAADGSIKGHFIVSPTDTWVLGQDTGENLLTLTACHPKFSARQRIIVQAELVGEPVPTIPRDEAVDLAPVTIEAGEADERAAEGGDEAELVISDEVAADDDPSVDADGNPIEVAGETDSVTDETDDSSEDDTDEAGTGADESTGETSEVADSAEATTADSESAASTDSVTMASAQTPFGTGDDDFGEGLNGDRTRIRPAIMWGLAAGTIWLAAWFIGMRTKRKWTLYAVAIIPFALVLWSSFVNIDQALPSY